MNTASQWPLPAFVILSTKHWFGLLCELGGRDGSSGGRDDPPWNHGGVLWNHAGLSWFHAGLLWNHGGLLWNHGGLLWNHGGVLWGHGGVLWNHGGFLAWNHDAPSVPPGEPESRQYRGILIQGNDGLCGLFGTLLHKPARKQGRNSQLERIALAHARACASWYLPSRTSIA